MADWIIKRADRYLSLSYDRLHELINDSKVIHADETPVEFMRIDDEKIKMGKDLHVCLPQQTTAWIRFSNFLRLAGSTSHGSPSVIPEGFRQHGSD